MARGYKDWLRGEREDERTLRSLISFHGSFKVNYHFVYFIPYAVAERLGNIRNGMHAYIEYRKLLVYLNKFLRYH